MGRCKRCSDGLRHHVPARLDKARIAKLLLHNQTHQYSSGPHFIPLLRLTTKKLLLCSTVGGFAPTDMLPHCTRARRGARSPTWRREKAMEKRESKSE